MRAIKLISLRKASWVPALALAMSLTLVVGQILNCCRINESISAGIGKILKSMDHSDGRNSAHAAAASHPGCHGHGKPSESKAASIPHWAPGPHVESDEACLSEVATAPKALQSNPIVIPDLLLAGPMLGLTIGPNHPPCYDQPKPQNKSSPPIYLLTLRLLV